MFLFKSDKNCGCYGNVLFLQTYNDNGKKLKLGISLGIFEIVCIV